MSAYRYIITDSQDDPLASALLESPVTAPVWQVRILEGGVDRVLEHEVVKLVSMDEHAPAKVGRILRHKGDTVALEPIDSLSVEARRNLRVPARFTTYLYPVSGAWEGRCAVTCRDLSCGGIAFFSPHPLEPGEAVEIAVPITEQPLLVRAEILRLLPGDTPMQLYSAKFTALTDGEEALLREAVFSQQLRNHGKPC